MPVVSEPSQMHSSVITSSSVAGLPSSQASPIPPASAGQLSTQFAMPSWSVSTSGTPHPQMPGATLSGSVGHRSPATPTYPVGWSQLSKVSVASPAPSPSVSAYQTSASSMITGAVVENASQPPDAAMA